MLRTDHSNLKWLHSFKEPEGQIACWLDSVQEFNFKVQHCKSTHFTALLRYPGVQENEELD